MADPNLDERVTNLEKQVGIMAVKVDAPDRNFSLVA